MRAQTEDGESRTVVSPQELRANVGKQLVLIFIHGGGEARKLAILPAVAAGVFKLQNAR
jgi:hypothetical protein